MFLSSSSPVFTRANHRGKYIRLRGKYEAVFIAKVLLQPSLLIAAFFRRFYHCRLFIVCQLFIASQLPTVVSITLHLLPAVSFSFPQGPESLFQQSASVCFVFAIEASCQSLLLSLLAASQLPTKSLQVSHRVCQLVFPSVRSGDGFCSTFSQCLSFLLFSVASSSFRLHPFPIFCLRSVAAFRSSFSPVYFCFNWSFAFSSSVRFFCSYRFFFKVVGFRRLPLVPRSFSPLFFILRVHHQNARAYRLCCQSYLNQHDSVDG